MFPAIMPWLMTLAPMNEAIGRENHTEKPLARKKIANIMIWVVIEDVW
jgi:hypothetical protein